MAGALARALASRQQAMRGDSDDEGAGDDDEWVCSTNIFFVTCLWCIYAHLSSIQGRSSAFRIYLYLCACRIELYFVLLFFLCVFMQIYALNKGVISIHVSFIVLPTM